MSDALSGVEARLAELAEAHRRLEARVAALEARPATRAPAGARAARPPAADVTAADLRLDSAAATRQLALVGRTLVVLAGAFLLRAMTDAGSVPAWLGIALGFAYAGAWIAMAYRAGPANPWSAGFHGVAAVAIGFPLLVEATSRFGLLSVAAASALLTALAGVALGVAALRRLEALAWIVEAGGVAAAIALMVASDRLAPPLLFLVALGVAALWLGYLLGWVYLRWPIAAVTNVLVALLVLRAVGRTPAEGPHVALFVAGALVALYLGSIAIRTLVLARGVVPFEVAQTAALLVVGLGGAALVTARSGSGGPGVGVAALAFGAASYAVAFAFVERRQPSKWNFYFYASVALVFVLAGGAFLVSGAALALAWAALALVTGGLARRARRASLAGHSVAYACAAALQSGALGAAARTIFGSPAAAWTPPAAVALAVAAAIAGAAWLTARVSPGAPRVEQRAMRCALLAVLAASLAGVAIGWILPAVAGEPGPGVDLGVAATVRTAVLVAGAVALAWLGRVERWGEAGWLAYPVLVVTAVKLLLEDIARSRPASLFLAFALYGAALIVVPRLRRRAPVARPEGAPTAAR